METLDEIVGDLRRRVQDWINAPNEASEALVELRGRLEALKATIGAKAAADAARALQGADKTARRARCKRAAERIAVELRPLNVIVEARPPLSRQRRGAKSKAATADTSKTKPTGTDAQAPAAPEEPKRSGWLGSRGER